MTFLDILKWIFVNENVWIPIKISLKFAAKIGLDNGLVPTRPSFEPMMVRLLTYMRHSVSMS